jgi:O-antigen ligase
VLKTIFILFLLSCSLGQLGRISLPTREIGLYLPDLLLVGGLGFYLSGFRLKQRLSPPRLTKPIFAFSVVALASLILSFPLFKVRDVFIGSLYLLRWIAYALVYFVIYKLARRGLKDVFGYILILGGLAVAGSGFIQLLVFPDFAPMTIYGWDPHYHRLISSFFDPNFTGGFLVLNLCLLVSFYLFNPKRLFLALSAIAYLALLLTYSRSAYLAFLISMIVLGFLKSKKVILVALLAFFFSLQMNPRARGRIEGAITVDDSAVHRFSSWEKALIIIKKHPFLGVGFNNYRYAQLKYGFLDPQDSRRGGHGGAGVDSSFLFVLATTGILGFVFFIWILSLAVRNSFLWARKSVYSLAFFSSLVGIFFHSFFVNSLFYPPIMAFLWTTFALAEADVDGL